MTYIPDVNQKYETKFCNGSVRKIPNVYYKKLVSDDPFVKGYTAAMNSLYASLSFYVNDGDRYIDILEAQIQNDYINKLKSHITEDIDTMIVSVIDGMDEEEHNKRMREVFGDEYVAYLKEKQSAEDSFKELVAKESMIEEL